MSLNDFWNVDAPETETPDADTSSPSEITGEKSVFADNPAVTEYLATHFPTDVYQFDDGDWGWSVSRRNDDGVVVEILYQRYYTTAQGATRAGTAARDLIVALEQSLKNARRAGLNDRSLRDIMNQAL